MSTVLSDRRRCVRVRVDGDAFVCLASADRKPWHILDISKGGLSFRYLSRLETKGEKAELEIITRDTSFSVEGVPFRTVSDTEIAGTAPLRRRGVQFGDLTEVQTTQLDHFISLYSAGPA